MHRQQVVDSISTTTVAAPKPLGTTTTMQLLEQVRITKLEQGLPTELMSVTAFTA